MVWDNSISISDIISSLALLATFITVLLILVQRHDAAKPALFVRAKNKEVNVFKYTGEDFTFILENNYFELGCSGNCLAKGVDIESYLLLDKEPSFYKHLSIGNGIIKTSFEGKRKCNVFVRPTKVHIEAVNCNEIINISNEVSAKLLGMVLCCFDAAMQCNEKELPISQSCVVLKIDYFDVLNKRYVDYYTLSLELFSFLSPVELYYSFTTRKIGKKDFNHYIAVYKKQNCCGWFSEKYIPSYDKI